MEPEVQKLINENAINDLKSSYKKRDCLNQSNEVLHYISNAVKYIGFLLIALGNSIENVYLQWIGLGLSLFGDLLNEYKRNHVSMLKTLLADITNIQNGNYIDSENILNGIDVNRRQDFLRDSLRDPEDPKSRLKKEDPKSAMYVKIPQTINLTELKD